MSRIDLQSLAETLRTSLSWKGGVRVVILSESQAWDMHAELVRLDNLESALLRRAANRRASKEEISELLERGTRRDE